MYKLQYNTNDDCTRNAACPESTEKWRLHGECGMGPDSTEKWRLQEKCGMGPDSTEKWRLQEKCGMGPASIKSDDCTRNVAWFCPAKPSLAHALLIVRLHAPLLSWRNEKRQKRVGGEKTNNADHNIQFNGWLY